MLLPQTYPTNPCISSSNVTSIIQYITCSVVLHAVWNYDTTIISLPVALHQLRTFTAATISFLAAISNRHIVVGLGNMVQCGSYHQSCPTWEGSTGCETWVWPQTWPPWKTAHLTCCSRAVCNPLHMQCSMLMFLDVSECTCSVTSSGNEFQASHVVFYPCPTNTDAVSHPVSAWNIARACDFSDPYHLIYGPWAVNVSTLMIPA